MILGLHGKYKHERKDWDERNNGERPEDSMSRVCEEANTRLTAAGGLLHPSHSKSTTSTDARPPSLMWPIKCQLSCHRYNFPLTRAVSWQRRCYAAAKLGDERFQREMGGRNATAVS